MTHNPLTDAELARLRAAGIEYPWHPRQTLRLLDEVERLRADIRERDRMVPHDWID